MPKLAQLKSWLEEKQPKVAAGTLTAKAIGYTLNQWEHLTRYCEHGQLRLSNVLAENAIRPFAVGRKAWLFADTPDGARASAAWFSLIETAKANGLEAVRLPPARDRQHRRRGHGRGRSTRMLPWNMS